ncbi:hypothetical protein RZS08_28100, partial [Arthrospira platensis SPKY1]|nr:hypothetical protein [Arthrospira platensis SPKY1]
MKNINQFINEEFGNLTEGINDPSIFKAIFLAGGPGSGKTFIGKNALPNSAYGLKFLDSDYILEYMLRQQKMSMNMNIMTPAELEKFAEIRNLAKDKTEKLK